ncbi:hypothetical protein N9L68_08715 [bacterium]|nr:hypothetical protein [bacterium]
MIALTTSARTSPPRPATSARSFELRPKHWPNRYVCPIRSKGFSCEAGNCGGTGKSYSSEVSEDDEPKGRGKGNLCDGAAGIVAAAPFATQVAASSRHGVSDLPLDNKSGAEESNMDNGEYDEYDAEWGCDDEEHPGDDNYHDEYSFDEKPLVDVEGHDENSPG